MKYFKFLVILFLFFFFSCEKQSSSNELLKIISRYEKEIKHESDSFSSLDEKIKFHQVESENAQKLIDKLKLVSEQGLNESQKISKELLLFVLQDIIDRNKYNMHLNPITNEVAFHLNLGDMGSQKLKTKAEIKNYLKQLEDLPKKIKFNLSLLKAGLQAGVSQPKEAFNNYSFTYNRHIVANIEESDFYKPFLNLPSSISGEFRDSIVNVAKVSVKKNAVNQYKKIKLFFEEEYFPNTRKGLGVGTIKNGKEFYQNRINYFTTSTKYTAEEIHQIGLQEVARIKAEMQKIINDLGFEGSFLEFLDFLRKDEQFYPKTAKELLMFARDISKRIDAELPKYFKTLPRKPYGVVAVPAAIAANYTGGRYSPSKNDTSAGFYWVNTYNLQSRPLYTLPALTAHEAVPGHHLQMSLNNELPKDQIPEFRRNLYLSAYGEGWGLYAESLANEMGIYRTPYEKFGKYTYEMWRACRLVVDTGIHSKGWSREQVIKYMSANTALSIHEIITETDRYITWPGQAISYKIGEIKIRELRKKAEKELKTKFNIRDFHEVILGEGTVTLSILENRVNNYINNKLNE